MADDDAEMDIDKDGKDGPRFVVKKWCDEPFLSVHAPSSSLFSMRNRTLASLHNCLQERRHILVLGYLHR